MLLYGRNQNNIVKQFPPIKNHKAGIVMSWGYLLALWWTQKFLLSNNLQFIGQNKTHLCMEYINKYSKII